MLLVLERLLANASNHLVIVLNTLLYFFLILIACYLHTIIPLPEKSMIVRFFPA